MLRPLVELVRSGKAGAGETGVLAFLATLGGPQELALLLDRVAASSRPIEERTRLLEALEQATRQRNVRPAGDLTRLLPLLKEDNESLRSRRRACIGSVEVGGGAAATAGTGSRRQNQ